MSRESFEALLDEHGDPSESFTEKLNDCELYAVGGEILLLGGVLPRYVHSILGDGKEVVGISFANWFRTILERCGIESQEDLFDSKNIDSISTLVAYLYGIGALQNGNLVQEFYLENNHISVISGRLSAAYDLQRIM